MMHIKRILDDPANVSLNQLVWTAKILPTVVMDRPREWLEIQVVHYGSSYPNHAGMKKVILRMAGELD
jgi:hypothetical protein